MSQSVEARAKEICGCCDCLSGGRVIPCTRAENLRTLKAIERERELYTNAAKTAKDLKTVKKQLQDVVKEAKRLDSNMLDGDTDTDDLIRFVAKLAKIKID